MKHVLRFSIALLMVAVLAIALVFAWQYEKQHITVFDTPKTLSEQEETIEVAYIRWACDCANWLPVAARIPGSKIQAEDCIFIEPASADQIIPESFFASNTNRVQLTGSYYEDRGIARGYEMQTPEKPSPARVFRYHSYTVIAAR